MPTYRAFGYVIDSDIELPDLPSLRAEARADWRIATARGSFVGDLGTAIGAEAVHDGVQVHAFVAGDVRSLAFDDTGVFQIRPADRAIAWFPGAKATEAAVRADVVGRVLALAAHVDGHLALHASAVSIGGRAIAFLGPKHVGKSTLALALVRGGARLIADDSLVVRMSSGTAAAAPGVQRVRLWRDAARALGAGFPDTAGAKPVLDCLTPNEVTRVDVPLAACYVLGGRGEAPAPVCRRRLSPAEAAMACVRFAKLGALTGGVEAPAVLDRAAALTRLVPVFTTTVTRDLRLLDRLGARFLEWHAEHDLAPS